jgi:hypothetical protein
VVEVQEKYSSGRVNEVESCIASCRAEWEELLLENLARCGCKNPLTGRPLRIEDSPGNITIAPGKDGAKVRYITETGAPLPI